MQQGFHMPGHKSFMLTVFCAIAVAMGASLVQPARATDQTIDLDKNAANGQESKVSTGVLQTYPVQIENTIFNNAPGTSFTFNWTGAGQPVTHFQVPIEEVRKASEDFALMLEWFDRVGYEADIAGNAKAWGIKPTPFAEWAAGVTWGAPATV